MNDKASSKAYKLFFFLQFSQIFTLLGSSIVRFALIWWITIETENPIFLSVMFFLAFIPQVTITPFIGVLVDKYSRKYIILVADSLQAFVTFILYIVFSINAQNVIFIFIIYTIRSVLQILHLPTYYAIIPTIVPKEKLNRVNGINHLTIGLISLIGPIFSALLIEIYSIKDIFLIDIFTFLIALIPLIIIKIPRNVSIKSEEENDSSLIKNLKSGILEIKKVPGLFSLIFLAILFNFLIRPIMLLMPYYIYVIHSGTALDLSLVFIFYNLGNISAAILNSLKKQWKHKVNLIILGLIGIFISNFFIIFAPIGLFLLMGLGLFIQGFLMSPINTIYLTLLQTVVPKNKVGRIISIDHTLSMAINPIGTIIAGPLAEMIGTRLLYFLFAGIGIGSIICFLFFTRIRELNSIE